MSMSVKNVIEAVVRGDDLRRITKEDMARAIKHLCAVPLPLEDRLVKVYCRKQSCKVTAVVTREEAKGWACSDEHRK